jgi:hypothetical protein
MKSSLQNNDFNTEKIRASNSLQVCSGADYSLLSLSSRPWFKILRFAQDFACRLPVGLRLSHAAITAQFAYFFVSSAFKSAATLQKTGLVPSFRPRP